MILQGGKNLEAKELSFEILTNETIKASTWNIICFSNSIFILSFLLSFNLNDERNMQSLSDLFNHIASKRTTMKSQGS